MKYIEIMYNPYINSIHFKLKNTNNDSSDSEYMEIDMDSKLQKFQGTRCIFENCVEEILDIINKYFNTSGNLIIEFIGTGEDFGVLQNAVKCSENPKSKGIECEFKERYPSSSDALRKIRDAYEQIKTEFSDYINNDEFDEDDERAVIGQAITKFQDTVKAEIPVCVIGNYSVGKSALVNALVGLEILPSHANSTTAKNVLLKNGQEYSLCFDYKGSKYVLLIDGNEIKHQCDGDVDEDLIQELTNGIDGFTSEEQILHQIIENLNTETSE